jgi:hypothetical protein
VLGTFTKIAKKAMWLGTVEAPDEAVAELEEPRQQADGDPAMIRKGGLCEGPHCRCLHLFISKLELLRMPGRQAKRKPRPPPRKSSRRRTPRNPSAESVSAGYRPTELARDRPGGGCPAPRMPLLSDGWMLISC